MLEFLEERTVGKFSIIHFDVSEEDARRFNIQQLFNRSNRTIDPGRYTKIVEGHPDNVWMSDTPAERRDHAILDAMLDRAIQEDIQPKTVLMFGLGIGYATSLVIEKGFSCKVIELNQDVIELVGMQIQKRYPGKIEIVQADALEYMPTEDDYFAIGWYDIWPTICTDNWEQYQLLYNRWRDHTYYQSAWAEYNLLCELREPCDNCGGTMECPDCEDEGGYYEDEDDEDSWVECDTCQGNGGCEYCDDGYEYSEEYVPEFEC